jgi:predicted DNA-binding helix-hairpin-helix protein
LRAFTCRFFVLCFPTTKSRGIYRTRVSINYDLSESVEIPEWSNDKNNADIIEKVEKLHVTEEVERSAEEVNADVVEMIEDAHEVMSGEVYVMIL